MFTKVLVCFYHTLLDPPPHDPSMVPKIWNWLQMGWNIEIWKLSFFIFSLDFTWLKTPSSPSIPHGTGKIAKNENMYFFQNGGGGHQKQFCSHLMIVMANHIPHITYKVICIGKGQVYSKVHFSNSKICEVWGRG